MEIAPVQNHDSHVCSCSIPDSKDKGAPRFPGNHPHETTPSARATVIYTCPIVTIMVLRVALRHETPAQFTKTDAEAQVLHCLTHSLHGLAHSHSPVMLQ